MTNRERQALERLRNQLEAIHNGGPVPCVALKSLLEKTAADFADARRRKDHIRGWACGVQFALDMLTTLDDRPWTAVCLN
jgi:hypothetical protein